jgi:homoserine dehydrogenase
MPALEAVSNSPTLRSFSGVVNGTCNFICDELAKGESRDAAILAAQNAGFAESDPTLDISGCDSAQKLCLLAHAAFGIDLREDDVGIKGIEDLEASDVSAAIARGNVMRLVASCRMTNDGVEAKVEPVELPSTHPFADLKGADNSLLLEYDDGSIRVIRGRGAGRWATTEAVVADLLDLRKESLRQIAEPIALARAAGQEVHA